MIVGRNNMGNIPFADILAHDIGISGIVCFRYDQILAQHVGRIIFLEITSDYRYAFFDESLNHVHARDITGAGD